MFARYLAPLCLLFAAAPGLPLHADIRVVGSDFLREALAPAVRDFTRQNEAEVRLDLRGTRPGLDDLRDGRADVGLFLLPPGEKPPADSFVSRVIGYHVAVLIVPAASPVTQITYDQLRGIFGQGGRANFSRWGDLGLTGEWSGRAIALHAPGPAVSLVLPMFQRLLLNGGVALPAVEAAASRAQLEQQVRQAENAIGLSPALPPDGSGLRVLSVAASARDAAYAPTPENLHSGDYALRLPLYVVFRREAAPGLLLFLKFLLDEEGGAAALARADFQPAPLGVRNQLVFELEELH